jgi:KDO2-lipid IV(A) lauroyltransferase
MKKILFQSLLKILSKLPLGAIRSLGAIIGLIALRLSNKSAKRLPHNLLITGLANPDNVAQMTKDTAKALGMTLAESALIAWQKDPQRISKLFQTDESFNHVKNLLSQGKQIVFLTPHIGNFELAVKYFAYHLPMNLQILYKPAKDPIIEEIIYHGRSETNITPVPTNRKGVLQLMKHIKSGQTIGILPDNVASGGDGEWVKFFGQDVYATSLSAKICQMPNIIPVIVQSMRTKHGFIVKCIPFNPSSSDIQQIMQELYHEIEKIIVEAPEQYYWSYDRFRDVNGAKPKPQEFKSKC